MNKPEVIILSIGAVDSYRRKYVHEVLVNHLGGLSLSRKSVVRLTDRPDMSLDVYRGRKTTTLKLQLLYKTFSCSTQLSMKFFLLIHVKMPTIVGILTCMSGGKIAF